MPNTETPKFGQLAMQQGLQMAGQAGSGILGLLFGKAMDKRQLKQQKKLQDMQIAGNMQIGDYNYAKQLQMWKDTNYSAQMAELEKAGLNPGLLYGMGGAGGSTTGSGMGSGVTGAEAPKGGGEIQMQQGIGLQRGLLEAQKRVLETQAEKNQAEADKTKGVDTEQTKTSIESLSQGIENQKLQADLMRIEARIKRLDLGFQEHSFEDRLEYIEQQQREMTGKATQALVQGNLDAAARETRLNIIKAEYIKKILENGYITAQTKGEYQRITESEASTRLKDKQFDALVQDIMRQWDGLSNENQKVQLIRGHVGEDDKILQGVINSISNIITLRAGLK